MNIRDKYIVIVGCSYFGSNIAASLSEIGNDVIVIDIDEEALDKLPLSYSGFKTRIV